MTPAENERRMELLTLKETAAELKIGVDTAYRLVKAKSPAFPKAIKVGGQWRVPRFQIDRFILDQLEQVAS